MTVLALYRIHEVKTMVKIDKIGKFKRYLRRNLRGFVDLRVAKRAFCDRRIGYRVSELRWSFMAILALQLGRSDMRLMAERRQ